MTNGKWLWLGALLAGLALFLMDLPYILLACTAGYCDASWDAPFGAFVVIKGTVAAGVLGWISASVDKSMLRAFLVGAVAVSLEALASGGLLYAQFLRGAPRPSDLASIPIDATVGMVFILWVGSWGGLPATVSAYLRCKLASSRRKG
jgi:hypothetical protein